MGTERQASKAAAQAVEDSLWAFRADILASFLIERNPYLRGSSAARLESALQSIQESLSEDATPIIRALIGDWMKAFIAKVVGEDGRGLYLAAYDHEEFDSDEIRGLPKGRWAYRIN
ncbi:MAG: hypothetical protein IPK82_23985 [Polyangiaceae bacterium]|nr:hypothetical protein [Polyangiaceae bacterium]